MFKEGISEAQIIANLKDEFLEDAQRRLDMLIESRRVGARSSETASASKKFAQELHTLKGMGQSFGFGSITLICRRLEYYLKGAPAHAYAEDNSVELFLSAVEDIIEGSEEPSDEAIEAILDSLPEPAEIPTE